MQYDAAIQTLQQKVLRRGIHYNLDTVQSALKELGHPEDQLSKVIHLAGTNGKGSTLSFLASGLKSAGKTVGTYTSPHILSYCERIQLNGCPISEKAFVELFLRIKDLSFYPDLTEFECLTLMMFLFMGSQQPDFLLLETGLGGRLDATNVVPKYAAVLTTIGLDHEAILGDTIQAVAEEKAGIIQAKTPVFSAAQLPEAETVIRGVCHQKSAPLTIVEPLAEMPKEAQLQGHFQLQNRALAQAVLDFCVPNQPVLQQAGALNSAQHWGRLTRERRCGKDLVLDGAHNPSAIRSLVQTLQQTHPEVKWHIVIQVSVTKDLDQIIKMLDPITASVTYVQSADPQFWTPESQSCQSPMTVIDEAAMPTYLSQLPDPILVTGSLYFIAKFKSLPATLSL